MATDASRKLSPMRNKQAICPHLADQGSDLENVNVQRRKDQQKRELLLFWSGTPQLSVPAMTEHNAAGISSHTGNVDEKFVPVDPVDNEKIQVEEEETQDQVQNDTNVQNGNLKRNLKTRHLQMSKLTHSILNQAHNMLLYPGILNWSNIDHNCNAIVHSLSINFSRLQLRLEEL